ncbi:hypothetical protein BBP40_011822 [Aspergillus hancockii]|nr:hypothetical protein BBP40_011822 [Aspergillus hancockii]
MPDNAQTNIDRSKCDRVVPMKVLCLGLPRTGTTSLRNAFKMLGYEDTYHMDSLAKENPRDGEMWLAALQAKYDGKGKFEKENWDRLLGHCQAVTDYPCSAFGPELIKAYPDAKVILNTRDIDSWYKSMMNTLGPTIRKLQDTAPEEGGPLDPLTRETFLQLVQGEADGDYTKNTKDLYHRHHELIRRIVPKENLLEYRVEEGWSPLCEFLDHPVPSEPFPVLNETKIFQSQWEDV